MRDEDWYPLVGFTERCAVSIEDRRGKHLGSGFFVSRGQVLTCAHVVRDVPADGLAVRPSGGPALAVEGLRRMPDRHGDGPTYAAPDLALLDVAVQAAHPSVWLSGPVALPAWSRAIAVGFSQLTPAKGAALDTATLEVVGTGSPGLLKLRGGPVPRGMSGSAVLDVQTGAVAGVVKAAWSDGGAQQAWIVPIGVVLATFPELGAANVAEHPPGSEWRDHATARRRYTRQIFRSADPVVAPPAPTDPPPSWWLNPRHQVVGFQPRPEFDALLAWATDQAPDADVVRLVRAPGGAGKTRLALELAARLSGTGWIAGVLQVDDPATLPGIGAAVAEAAGRGHRILLALDYVEGFGDEIARLIGALPLASVRVLLLARSAGAWWVRFEPDGEARYRTGRTPVDLSPFATGGAVAAGHFATALQVFRRCLHGSDAPAQVPNSLISQALRQRDVLQLHALALVSALHERDHGELPRDAATWRDPLEELVRHEGRHLARSTRRLRLHEDPALLDQLLLVPTLVGARTGEQAVAAVGALPAMQGRPARPVAALLHDTYPAGATALRWWAPLPLDRLAETLLARIVTEDIDPLGYLSAIFAATVGWQAVEGLVLLLRVAGDPAVPAAVRTRVSAAVADAARAREHELLGALYAAERRVSGEAPVAATIVAELTWTQAAALADRMRRAGREELARFGLGLLDHVDTTLDQARSTPNPMLMYVRAQLLGQLGQYEQALRLTDVQIALLAETERQREQHAVDPNQELVYVRQGPDGLQLVLSPSEQSEALALLLQVRARVYAADGRRPEELAARRDAIAAARRAARTEPKMRAELAIYLVELAQAYVDAGADQQAEALLVEAVELQGEGPSAGIATAAAGLARLYDRQGRRDDARLLAGADSQEAAELADAALPRVVQRRLKQVIDLIDDGRFAEAQAPAAEVLEQLRELTDEDPHTHARNLATVLAKVATLEPPPQRLAMIAEAVQIMNGRLGAASPHDLQAHGVLLLRQAMLLHEFDRTGEALAATEEAEHLFGELAASAPGTAAPRRATALEMMAVYALAVGRAAQAADATARLSELLDRPDAATWTPGHSAAKSCHYYRTEALSKLADDALQAGDTAGALRLFREALVSVRRFVAGQHPANNLRLMAAQASLVSVGLHTAGDHALAVLACDAAESAAERAADPQMQLLVRIGRLHLYREHDSWPEAIAAATAILDTYETAGVELPASGGQQLAQYIMHLTHRPDAVDHRHAAVGMLMRFCTLDIADAVAPAALLRAAFLQQADGAAVALDPALLTAVLRRHGGPHGIGAAVSPAAAIPVAQRLPVCEAMVAGLRDWSEEERHDDWLFRAISLVLCGETLAVAGRIDEALACLTEAVDVVRPHATEMPDLFTDVLARAFRVCQAAGRTADWDAITREFGETHTDALFHELGVRADRSAELASEARACNDPMGAAVHTAQALGEAYASFDGERIARAHLDHAVSLRALDPFDPDALAHLVAAGVISTALDRPVNVGSITESLYWQAGWHDIGTVAALAFRVDATPGVQFGRRVGSFEPVDVGQRLLDAVLRAGFAGQPKLIAASVRYRMLWDPCIMAVLLARTGDTTMGQLAAYVLAAYADSVWSGVAAGLTRILAGDEKHALEPAADDADAIVIMRCRNALRGSIDIGVTADLARAAPIGGLLAMVHTAMVNGTVTAELRADLTRLDRSGEWHGLAPRLHELLDGRRDPRLQSGVSAPVRAVLDFLLNA